MTDCSSDTVERRQLIKEVVLGVLDHPVEPGMGGPAEPIWQVYNPEGVAIVIANAVSAALAEAEDNGRTEGGRA